MTIKVTKRGTPPKDKIYKAKCYTCQSEMEFKRKDAKYVPSTSYDQRDCDVLRIECPVCGAPVSTAV